MILCRPCLNLARTARFAFLACTIMLLAACGSSSNNSSPTYSVGGTISGLTTGKSLTLANNGADALLCNTNGAFTFTTKMASSSAYSVTVQSAEQNCAVTSGATGTIIGNITGLVVSCGLDSFTAGGTLATQHGEFHTATQLANGKVLVSGGHHWLNGFIGAADLYDPTTNTWSAAAAMANARYYHTATLLANGKILVVGGWNGSGALTSAELYDPSANTWTAAAPLATKTSGHTATLLANGKVLISGGSDGITIRNDSQLYDPTANTWTAAGSMGNSRYSHTATLLNNGKVLVSSGKSSDGYITDTELYDPATNSWTKVGSLAFGRYKHTATLMANGKVLITGGQNTTVSSTYYSSAELFNPATNTWSSAASMSTVRQQHAATLLANGKVLVTGGQDSAPASLSSAELYDPATDTWAAASSLSGARYGHTSTLLNNGKVLVNSWDASADLYW